ncbi:MAG TPA: uroporphyrinogen decarboxylase family protein [Bryobacteraceae bacterium]|nr:uroporphyrinogen decarboxylase family protein [Bryobacteraceae bacterium]
MTSRERVAASLAHREPDRVPFDLGSTNVTGVHVSVVAALRAHYGLEHTPVKVIEPGQMLGEIDEELKVILGIDTAHVARRMTRYAFAIEDWKPFRMDDGLEVLVPGGFVYTKNCEGDTLLYPQGDITAPPSAIMPQGGYFFDSIIRQEPIDEERLNPADNLEEFTPISDSELDHLEGMAAAARATGRAVIGSFGGTSFGDIALVPGAGLKHPKGIRDVAEWYVSTRARRDYVHAVFAGQTEIALANLKRIHERVGDTIDVINVCGTDFGTQSSTFCSVESFNELWAPYYKAVTGWIHANTSWKVFKHSCGSVSKLIPAFLECGFDILNPVQCSAARMDPAELKREFGERIVFWGGGVDTQKTLPFGTPEQVREEVLRRREVFAPGSGFVFNTVHNIQARTPVENVVAMVEALRE